MGFRLYWVPNTVTVHGLMHAQQPYCVYWVSFAARGLKPIFHMSMTILIKKHCTFCSNKVDTFWLEYIVFSLQQLNLGT